MPLPPHSADEAVRLAALHGLNILDTASEERFDRITRTAARLFDVPIVLISLVDANRLWFKSCLGLLDIEIPRSISFCAHAIQLDEPLVIPDAEADPRFADNQLVTGEPFIRFYAGQPLSGPDGRKLGTLCIMDRRSRHMSTTDLQALKDLAVWAENELNSFELSQALLIKRESKSRVRSILDGIPDAIVTFDAQGVIESLNPSAERLFGYQGHEVIGKLLNLFIVNGNAAAGNADTVATTANMPIEPLISLLIPELEIDHRRPNNHSTPAKRHELLGRRRDGSVFNLEIGVSLMRQGPPPRFIGSMRDISVRKRSERALYQLASIVEFSHDAIIGQTLAGTIISWNAGAERMYGYTAHEAIGQPISILMPTERPDDIDHILEQIGAGHAVIRSETVGRRKDGRLIDVALTVSPVMDAAGKVIAASTIAHDITELKRNEAQLRDTFEALQRQYDATERARTESRAVLDAASEAIVLVGPEQRLISVNRRFVQDFGLEADAVVGCRFDELKQHLYQIFGDQQQLYQIIDGALEDATSQFTHIISQQWPELRKLELFSTPVVHENGSFLGRLYVFRDVTREHEADRMKSEFVSMVSHELRTPLTSIKGYVDLLLDGEVGELADEQAHFLKIVKNNADRLIRLINDLLDVSRVEAGKIELKLEPVHLARAIRNVQTLFRPQLEAKRQHLTLDLAEQLPPVFADVGRVTQILTNLLSNAHKYTPEQGEIMVRARLQDGVVRVDVQDTGIGLSPDEQQRIFDKFYRAKHQSTREIGGTGLGLSITEALVRLHGGEIFVTSEPGRGSTFSFTLPVADGEIKTETHVPLVKPSGRILVIDDDPDIAHLIQRYLERAGYHVLIGHTAEEGVNMAQMERPDLITLDIMLPNVDGFTALAWLKQDPRTTDIPVMLMSILPDIGRGRLVGAVDYLIKPVHKHALLNRIGQILADTRANVLVVDDDQDVREMLAQMLSQAGYRVITATDGSEALDLVRHTLPQLALVDVKMPHVDGITVLRELRANERTRDLPVIMMTATPGSLEDSRQVVEALGSTILAKPLTPEELAAAITTGLHERQME
ncbi:MAG: PAS domain S-box protein [Chloroflexota bacterium]|nr:PAS domain S-box protein [Chloroflexota bacterium]